MQIADLVGIFLCIALAAGALYFIAYSIRVLRVPRSSEALDAMKEGIALSRENNALLRELIDVQRELLDKQKALG